MRHKLFGERAAMGKSQCCCFSIMSAAATVGTLQLILICLYISNSALIYDNWNNWWTNPLNNVTTVGNSYLQVLVVNTMGFTVAWSVCLLFFAISFYFMNPQLVVPNMVAQLLAILWGALFIGGLSQAINEIPKGDIQFKTLMEKQKDTFLLAALIFAVVTWAFQLIFFWVLVKFRCYLMEQQGIVVALAKPEFHTSTVTTAHVRPSLNNNHQIHNEPMAFTMENPNMQDFQ